MATPTEPVTDALYKALSSPEPDPKVVHTAIEEIRQIASQNAIAVLGAQITELKAEMKTGFSEVNSRIDMLEKVVWRVIWPLIVLLATTVFGLLYRVIITAPG